MRRRGTQGGSYRALRPSVCHMHLHQQVVSTKRLHVGRAVRKPYPSKTFTGDSVDGDRFHTDTGSQWISID